MWKYKEKNDPIHKAIQIAKTWEYNKSTEIFKKKGLAKWKEVPWAQMSED